MKKKLIVMAGVLCIASAISAQTKVDFSKNKTMASERQSGFFAPSDGYIGLGYDTQSHRLTHAEGYKRDDYTLHGINFFGGVRMGFTKNGIVGLDMPIGLRFDWGSDKNYSGYKSISRLEMAMQVGFMASIGYRFAEKCYLTLSIGPKIDFTSIDMWTRKPESGDKKTIDYVTDKGYRYTSMIDIPLSGKIAFRYQMFGAYVMADYGTSNLRRDDFYKDTGMSKDYKVKSNRVNVGLQMYF